MWHHGQIALAVQVEDGTNSMVECQNMPGLRVLFLKRN